MFIMRSGERFRIGRITRFPDGNEESDAWRCVTFERRAPPGCVRRRESPFLAPGAQGPGKHRPGYDCRKQYRRATFEQFLSETGSPDHSALFMKKRPNRP